MRTHTAAALFMLPLLGWSGVRAEEAAVGATALPPVNVIHQQPSYQLAPREFDAYQGVYRFPGGETLKVWKQGRRYLGKLSGQPEQALLATAPGQFETAVGAKLQFEDEGQTVVLTQFVQVNAGADDGDATGAAPITRMLVSRASPRP